MAQLGICLISAGITLVVFSVVMLIRNRIVYNVRTAVLDECSDKAKRAISNGDQWEPAYSDHEKLGSYERMMWQFGKWTRNQFCR